MTTDITGELKTFNSMINETGAKPQKKVGQKNLSWVY